MPKSSFVTGNRSTSFPGKGVLVFIAGLISVWLPGCNPRSGENDAFRRHPTEQVATGYRLRQIPEGFRLSVINPWQGEGKKTFTYTLVRNRINKPVPWKPGTPIAIPVHSVICTSTTHVAFLHALDKTDYITGISGKSLISDSLVRKRIARGDIADIGYDRQLDIEKILSLHPDVVFMYGVDQQFSSTVNRLETLGIPVIIVGEYLEPSLLARLDWIRFFGAFFDETEFAGRYYDSVALRYNKLAEHPRHRDQPTVMTGLPWNEVWYVSGQGSLLANTIKDAGGDYLFADQKNPEALPWDIEKVYRMASNADLWINTGSAQRLSDIRNLDPRLEMFQPLQKGMVFNNNRRLTPGGGNDFWESGVICPDRILEDLQSIFYPAAGGGASYYYYRKLQE